MAFAGGGPQEAKPAFLEGLAAREVVHRLSAENQKYRSAATKRYFLQAGGERPEHDVIIVRSANPESIGKTTGTPAEARTAYLHAWTKV
jgi:hypothetical protein